MPRQKAKPEANVNPKVLKEQNKTIRDVIRKLKEFSKCAIIRPTGFGKTFMLSQLIKRYKKVLYIYPAAVVKDSVVEDYHKTESNRDDEDGNFVDPETIDAYEAIRAIPNCDLMTYAKLARMTNDDWAEMPRYDLVIFDEMHRMGGPMTQFAVNKLLVMNPASHIVGATATPTRMDNFDPVSIFFSDIMAYSYTLIDAIADGILKKPHYYYCVHHEPGESSDKWAEQACREAALTAGEDLRDPKVIEVLKPHIIEMAKLMSMDNVVKKVCRETVADRSYMKFIVFFSTISRMDDLIGEVQGWFESAFPKHRIDVLRISSRCKSETENTDKLETLSYKKNHIDLIACVDMLNMGYHVDNLTGVIMYRGTKSNTIFTQQLGRALSAQSDNSSVVIDVVDNLHRKAIYDMKSSFTEKPLRKTYAPRQTNHQNVKLYVVQDGEILSKNKKGELGPSPYHFDEKNVIVDQHGNRSTLVYHQETNVIYDEGDPQNKDCNRFTQDCFIVTEHEATYRELIAKAVAEPMTQRCKTALELHFRTWCRNNHIPYPITDKQLQKLYGKSKEEFYAEFCQILNRKQIDYPLQDAARLLDIGNDPDDPGRNVPLEICAKARNVSIQQILDAFGIAN